MKKYFTSVSKDTFNQRLVLLSIFIVIASLYLGTLLFGKSSLDILTQLEGQEKEIKKEIKHLLKSNETLQKEYFELKNLE